MAAKPCAPPSFSFKKPAEPTRGPIQHHSDTRLGDAPFSIREEVLCLFVDHRPVMISSTATAPGKAKHNLGWVGEAAEHQEPAAL
jgi:hypothetical protein